MHYIDPHIHMVSRTTDDYKRMALAGCVLVSEPAFWAGFDRSGAEGFRDYFRQLTEYECKRAAAYGIAHHCWLCINAKEAENVALSREVIAMIPQFLDRPGAHLRDAPPRPRRGAHPPGRLRQPLVVLLAVRPVRARPPRAGHGGRVVTRASPRGGIRLGDSGLAFLVSAARPDRHRFRRI